MCGIVGYCGLKPARNFLIEGLKRLEYRGYDSAGICVAKDKVLQLIKKKGKIRDMQSIVPKELAGSYGIGHTRWATHGEVNDQNAHPHLDGENSIALVHNGIIENFQVLRKRLESDGVRFRSDTDSEVLVHLIASVYNGDLLEAVKEAVSHIRGTFGIAVMHKDHPNLLVGARNGSPLVIGVGDDQMFLASDVTAVLAHTNKVIFLEDGEIVSISCDSYSIMDFTSQEITKQIENIDWELEEIEKQGFAHFMEKEIFEQPETVARAMQGRIDHEYSTAKLGGLNFTSQDLLNIDRIKIIAAGTSFHAGLVGAQMIESLARVPCTAELASEMRYRNPIVERNTIFFAVSQSGETADTLYALREIQRKGGRVYGICNVVGSSIARETDAGVYLHSGPEIAVASTKAFTSQITVFFLFSLLLARTRNLSWERGKHLVSEFEAVPKKIEKILDRKQELEKLAKKYHKAHSFLFLGRGVNYPAALEGALKLKEISYIHAEGYSAAEIKHGPIALINEETPSLFLVPRDALHDKIINNMKEVKARKGPVIAFATEGDTEVAEIADDVFYIPKADQLFNPHLFAVPTQLFAYYCALFLGRDVDQPRNLAKSVTVE